MGKKLANAPVYYTIAQVQFNHVLDLDSYIPAIQSKMRELQFPDFKKQLVQQVEMPLLAAQGEQIVPPKVSARSRYFFGDIAGRTAFILDTNALTLQTTAYDTFETFSETMLNGLKIVNDALNLALVERVGVRYLDAIRPFKEGETLRDFLVPEVLGFSLHTRGQLRHSFSETTVATAAGQLTARVLVREGPTGLPTDLSELPLAIDPRFTNQNGLHATVDTDASSTRRDAFDLAKVAELLKALHDEVDASFRATVTDHAWASWT